MDPSSDPKTAPTGRPISRTGPDDRKAFRLSDYFSDLLDQRIRAAPTFSRVDPLRLTSVPSS